MSGAMSGAMRVVRATIGVRTLLVYCFSEFEQRTEETGRTRSFICLHDTVPACVVLKIV